MVKSVLAPDYNQDRAEKLVQRLVAEPLSSKADEMMNDLLSEFHRGYPLENLRPLLHSQNQDVVNVGAWIASELGEKGNALLPDVFPLLQHPAKNVRFSIIDCILMWATDGAELSAVTRLLDDPESSVRWKTMDFLSLATRDQLQLALSHLAEVEPNSTHVRGLRWLLSSDASDANAVKSALHNENDLLRKYAVVAASRMSKANREPLSYAASVKDPDVQNFAKSSIRLLKD
jgi:hypothetical protein